MGDVETNPAPHDQWYEVDQSADQTQVQRRDLERLDSAERFDHVGALAQRAKHPCHERGENDEADDLVEPLLRVGWSGLCLGGFALELPIRLVALFGELTFAVAGEQA